MWDYVILDIEYIVEILVYIKLEWEEIYSENILIKMLELCII